jgi:hypothetical protein
MSPYSPPLSNMANLQIRAKLGQFGAGSARLHKAEPYATRKPCSAFCSS